MKLQHVIDNMIAGIESLVDEFMADPLTFIVLAMTALVLILFMWPLIIFARTINQIGKDEPAADVLAFVGLVAEGAWLLLLAITMLG